MKQTPEVHYGNGCSKLLGTTIWRLTGALDTFSYRIDMSTANRLERAGKKAEAESIRDRAANTRKRLIKNNHDNPFTNPTNKN